MTADAMPIKFNKDGFEKWAVRLLWTLISGALVVAATTLYNYKADRVAMENDIKEAKNVAIEAKTDAAAAKTFAETKFDKTMEKLDKIIEQQGNTNSRLSRIEGKLER